MEVTRVCIDRSESYKTDYLNIFTSLSEDTYYALSILDCKSESLESIYSGLLLTEHYTDATLNPIVHEFDSVEEAYAFIQFLM